MGRLLTLLNPPSAALFSTSVLSTGATVSVNYDSARGYSFAASDTGAASTDRNHFQGKAVPGGSPWTATFGIDIKATAHTDAVRFGVALYDSVSGKLLTFGTSSESGAEKLAAFYFTNANTYSSSPYSQFVNGEYPSFFQISFNGTSYAFGVSWDQGLSFQTLLTAAVSSYFTATHLGVNIETYGATNIRPTMNVVYYQDSGGSGGTWASTEAKDVASLVGYSGVPGYTGELVSTEAADVFSGHGYVASVGTFIVSEGPDVFSAFLLQPKTGHWASTEAPDTFAGTGTGWGETLTIAISEAPDVFAADGFSIQPVHGTFTVSERPDTARFLGAGVSVSVKAPVFFVT